MRRSRRVVVALAVSSLVTAGGITAGLSLVAHANLASSCIASQAAQATCTIGDTTITSPTAITIIVTLEGDTSTSNPPDAIKVTWAGTCVQGSNGPTAISSPTSPTPTPLTVGTAVDINVPFPSGMNTPDSCDITTTTGTLANTGNFIMTLNFTPSASASPTTSAPPPPSVNVSTIKGYANKCLDDRGNSSANRNAVIIWSCNTHDSAQGWKFTSGELKHNGKCLNDAGNGGSGTHVILWSCNGGLNEKWFHTGSGEFILSYSGHGLLCLDDPGNSTNNGTRLIVYKCRNTSNQHWT